MSVYYITIAIIMLVMKNPHRSARAGGQSLIEIARRRAGVG
jgi:hypothetical protein